MKVFPFEWSYPSTEKLNAQVNRKSSLIFILLIAFLVIILGSLPLIKIDVGVQARGIIRDVENNITISSNIQGRVLYHHLVEDRKVKKGEILLTLDPSSLETETVKIKEEIKLNTSIEKDLIALLNDESSPKVLHSGLYQQSFNQFSRELNALEIKKQFTQNALQRTEKLYNNLVVAKVELERAQLDDDMAGAPSHPQSTIRISN
jgi:membrane fusion protein, peptide pheromone/bacteriocin exporter